MIELENLSKHYVLGDNRVLGIECDHLHIKQGELVSIVGPSGSGKSTLLTILGLLHSPDRGRYLLNKNDVSQLNAVQRAQTRNRFLGFVLQQFHLFPHQTVAQNIETPLIYANTPRASRQARVMEMAQKVQIDHRLEHTPLKLSGGEQQRVAIARALVNHPTLLLADEPTGNLDSKTGEVILDLFEQLSAEGMTIVVVTHDQVVAERTRRVIRVKDGQIVSS